MTTSSDNSRTWIFQASPTAFDLRATLRSLTNFTWLVRAYRTEMRPGDRVYLWTAGPDGGVLALATITDKPSMRLAEAALRAFMREPETLDGVQLRVGLRVDHVLDRPLLRRDLLSHPVLADLMIIRVRQGTNFRVTSEQAAALADLVRLEPERSVFVCWYGLHVLSEHWVSGNRCPLCGQFMVSVRESDLDVDGAMATLIGEVPPAQLAKVRAEAKHLLRYEALNRQDAVDPPT